MTAISWLQGKDLVTVNVGSVAVASGDVSFAIQSGQATLLPAAPFYLFFPGNTGTGELPEYIYVSAKNTGTDVLTISAPPFGNTGGNGRAALRNDIYGATTHPIGTVIQLRSTWEYFQQLQTQMDGHLHDGLTGHGPQILSGGIADNAIITAKINASAVTTAKINDGAVTTAKLASGAATGAALGSDVVILTGTQTITGSKTFSAIVITGATITLGSDATNDMYYRSSGGALTRIAPTSNSDHTLGNVAGVPAWQYPTRRWSRVFMMAGM